MYIYSNVYKQMTDVELLLLHSNTWNHLTVCKNNSRSIKMLSTKCVQIGYLIYMYTPDLALNNLQRLIYYKNKPNRTVINYSFKVQFGLVL